MAEVKGEGDPAKRPNTPPGAMSREDLFKKSDDEHDNDAEFTDVADEDHDKLTEVVEETEQVEDKVLPEKKFKVKVNGQDREFTEAELIERASKTEAADQRFQEAARLKREAEELKSQLPQKDVEQPKVTDDDLAEARRLQMGSEEEAADVIRKLRQRPTLTEGDVVRKIDERLTFQSSVERFKQDYSDIVKDPYLWQLLTMKDEQLVAQQKAGVIPVTDYYERYKSIGDELRNWVGKTKTTPKEERKASITTLKVAYGRKAEPEGEDEEQSTSDTIANMAKARGQGYAK